MQPMAVLLDEWPRTLLWSSWMVCPAPLTNTGKQTNRFNTFHPEKVPSAIDCYTNEMNRVLGVLDRALTDKTVVGRR